MKIRELNAREAPIQEELHRQQRLLSGLQDPRQVYRMKLENVSRQRRNRSIDDCVTAMAWIDRHQEELLATGRLKGPVTGPIAMYCEATDSAAALAVERAVGTARMLAFLVEHGDDASLLIAEFKKQNLFADVYTMTHSEVPNPPVPGYTLRNEFAEFKLQGYLLDFINCPVLVKSFLTNFVSLHNMPFSKLDSPQVPKFF